MRKLRPFILIIALLLVALLATSCYNNPGNNDVTTGSGDVTDPDADKLTVTFDYRDGSEPKVTKLSVGETVSEPETPTRAEYDFGGWFTDEALSVAASFGSVTESVTYYAAWVPHTSCLVRFDSCGGSAVASSVAKKGSAVIAPETPARDGYTFVGWYSDAEYTTAFDFSTALSENVTLYASWIPAEGYAEVVGYIDGNVAVTKIVKKGEAVGTLVADENYLYSWYTEANWNTSANITSAYDLSKAVNADLKLYGFAYSDGLKIVDGTVVSYGGSDKNVIVPLVSDGKAVTAIGAKAFADCKTVLTVDLPATVTSIGSGAFSGCEKLVSVDLTSACTSVGAYVFSGCGRLTSFGSIDSLTDISEGAFLGCASLTSLTVPANVTKIGAYAFSGCTALSTLSFGDAVSTIGNYALSDCRSLAEFRIPSSLKSFGNGVLTGCASTLKISGGNDKFKTVNGSLCEVNGNKYKLIKYIPGENAESTLSLPSSVTAIGANAFYGNDTLTVVNLSGYTLEAGSLAGLKSLKELTIDNLPTGNNAYLAYYFGAPNGKANGATGIFVPSSLEKVTIRSGQTALADYAFFGCTGLKTVEGISGISSIGAYAFAYTAIETLKLPASVSSIGEGAFSRCEYLSAFETEGNNRYYSVYDGCLYNKSYTELLIVPRQKETVEFHSGVKKIASGAFFKSRVTSVSVPASVTEIEASAFAEADHLESLEVPFIGGSADENRYMIYIFGGTIYETTDDDGNPTYSVSNSGAAPSSLTKLTVTGSLSEIPDFAFAYLENVSEFSLSGNITSIGIYGFYETGLTEVVIPSTVKKVGAYAYASMDKLETVTVPGSVGDGLGDGVFYSNRSLKVIRFEEGVTAIPFAACYPYSYYDRSTGYTVCNSSLEEIYLPSTLKTIGDRAFAYAGTVFYAYDNMRFTDLKFVMTPGEGLVELGDSAFYMSSIKSIALPASLEKVGSFCFSYCKQLSSVTFGSAEKGSALTTVGGACFAYCTGLNTLTIYKRVAAVDDVPVLEQYKEAEDQVAYNVFEGTVAPTIYVYGSEYYRKAANWDSYDMSIYEIK